MVDSQNPDLLPGTLYMMVLRALHPGPLHGYGIAKRIRDCSKGDLQIEDGSLYPALNRMLLKGWLKSEWGVTDNNRRARFYRLTPAGRKQLEAESTAFNKMIRAIQLVMRTS
jgi:PadR family transcriptional regulator PadR